MALGAIHERGDTIDSCPLPASHLANLLLLTEDGTLASNQAREVFGVMLEHPERAPQDIAAALGFKATDTAALTKICEQVIAQFPDKVAEILGGNDKILNFLTGQVMKNCPEKPNPKLVTDSLRSLIHQG